MAKTKKPIVISILNMKGGVGKTTLSVNVAYIMSTFHSKKVLLIDIDPQFNATQYLVSQADIIKHLNTKKTTYDILMPEPDHVNLTDISAKRKKKNVKLEDYVIRVSEGSEDGYFDLIPSSLALINLEYSKRGTEKNLSNFIRDYCNHYDVIIIDCPPTLSIYTSSAFLASDYYIIPIKPDNLSSVGLPLLEKGLEEYEKTYDHTLTLLGLVFTMVDNRPYLTFDVMKNIKNSGRPCFSQVSSLSTKVASSVDDIVEFYNEGGGYVRYQDEFKEITNEILNKL